MLSETFKAELANLSPQDKLDVFESIRSTVFALPERDFAELSSAQEHELMRRANEAAKNPGAGSAWHEVKQRILGT